MSMVSLRVIADRMGNGEVGREYGDFGRGNGVWGMKYGTECDAAEDRTPFSILLSPFCPLSIHYFAHA